MSSDKYDYISKLFTIGRTYVDKTEFIFRFTNDIFIKVMQQLVYISYQK